MTLPPNGGLTDGFGSIALVVPDFTSLEIFVDCLGLSGIVADKARSPDSGSFQISERPAVIQRSSQARGISLILGGAVLIGLMPSAAKFAYAEGANVLAVILGRSIIGVIILIGFIAMTGQANRVSVKNMRLAAVSGLTHVAAAIGILASIVYIDISLANIILFLFPFPIAVIAHYRGETRLTTPILALMGLAIVGLVLVLGVDLASLDPRGIAIAVMGMFGFTAMVISMTDLTKVVGAPHSNLLMTIWAVLVFGAASIIGPIMGAVEAVQLPNSPFGWIALGTVGVTFSLGYLGFFIGANIIGAARAATLSISEPVMIILFAVLLVGERLSPIQWIGVFLVVGCLALTELLRR